MCRGVFRAFGANAVLENVACFGVVLVAVFAVFEDGDAVSAVARVDTNDDRIRSVRDRFFAIGVCLVLQLMITAASVCLECSFCVRRPSFRLDDCAVNDYRVVAVGFGINANLDERAYVAASGGRLYLAGLEVLLRVVARLVTSLLRQSFAVSQVCRASVREGGIEAIVLREDPYVVEVDLTCDVIACLRCFLVLYRPLVNRLLECLLDRLFANAGQRFGLCDGANVVLYQRGFYAGAFNARWASGGRWSAASGGGQAVAGDPVRRANVPIIRSVR